MPDYEPPKKRKLSSLEKIAIVVIVVLVVLILFFVFYDNIQEYFYMFKSWYEGA